ncbi:hypothetical protein G5C60_21360 [Streptomyces sp. HC44]|uniref:DUF3153 domain-containing protein n=1 Tax=Streptomyces scabichelini TaxID=2711217 RepID=A0A6G4V7N0_9ACTN|nr:hypothetical protein [Streptomyces scabichelini]NGO10069.1 hypothetical protein [Streptomyces scabichelini]
MTRARPAVRAALAVLITVLLASCGSSAPKTSAAKLFQEYTKSTEVKNDKFPSDGGSSADRLSNFAAYYTPEQLQYALLAATACVSDTDADTDADTGSIVDPEADCSPDASVREAARDFAGASGELFQRSVLVKHEDGSLELVTLYVARASDRSTALIDPGGAAYTGGLEDFRRHNDLFSPKDLILTPEGIDSVPGEGKVVAVSGHTPLNWTPWAIGGAAVVVLSAAGFIAARRFAPQRRIRTRSPAQPAIDAPPE